MEDAYSSIGRAVVAEYLAKTQGYIPAGAFKVPVRNVVKALSTGGKIAPDLEERLTRYVEERHLLVHRWIVQNGWPDEADVAGFAPIIELARRVENEANSLAKSLTSYMVKYASPDWASQHEQEYHKRVARLFRDVHIDVESDGT